MVLSDLLKNFWGTPPLDLVSVEGSQDTLHKMVVVGLMALTFREQL